MTDAAAPADPDDELVAKLSDYLDGALSADDRAQVDAKLASDAEWQRVRDELVEQRKMISGLRRAAAPPKFTSNVTSTIRKRSRGRFFAFGYRVPFGVLLVVALVVLLAVAWLMRSSDRGSQQRDTDGSADRVPIRPD